MKKNVSQDVRLYGRLLKYIKPYWYALLLGLLATAVFSGVDAAATYLIKPLVNEGFINKKDALIKWAPLAILVAFGARSIANFVSNYAMTWVSRTVVMELRREMFKKLFMLPAHYFDTHSSGSILSKLLYDVEKVAQVSTDAITEFVQNLFFVIGLLVVMLSISWKLSLIYFSTVPLILVVVTVINNRIRRISRMAQQAMGHVTEVAEESIEGYSVIRMFSGEDYETSKFNLATKTTRSYDLKLVVSRSVSVSLVQMIAAICIASIVYLAITPGFTTVLTAGGFASMIAAMLALLKPLKSLTKISADIQKGLAGAQSVFAFLDERSENDSGQLMAEHPSHADITFENIRFRYQADTDWILKDVSLNIQSGQSLALVGRSGSGKSTLIKLLTRFYDFEHGDVRLNDISIQDMPLTQLRKHIAVVSQHVILFNGTIRENIAYGMAEQVEDDKLIEIAQAAYAWNFIQDLPYGLDTIIGENGVLLSGGQRQRIAIARALLKDAPILILDEATSALDTESERAIQKALDNLMKNRTTIIIAHRLSTIEKADQIAVLDRGVVIETGTHASLIRENGIYTKLHAMNQHESSAHDPEPALV